MSLSVFESCHSKDFCPFKLSCSRQSQTDETFRSTPIQMKKNEIVWSTTPLGQHVHVLKSGLFASFVPFEDGRETLFALFPKGIVSGVAELWVDAEAACAYGLKCLVPGAICRIPAEAARLSLAQQENTVEIVANLLTNNASCSLEMTRILGAKSTIDKVTALFLALRDMLPGRRDKRSFRFTHEEIGSIVSEDRLAVFRALRELEARGAVEQGYGKVAVNYPLLPHAFSSCATRSPFFYAH